MYKVFLSSTSRDLAPYREAVHRAIDGLPGFQLIMMEDFGARDANAKDLCARLVRESDVFVGLLGHYYGSCPPGESTSFTELEYGAAKSANIPRLMFIAPDHFAIPANLVESDESFKRQLEFRRKVIAERVVASFDQPEQLASAVTKALFVWYEEQRQAEASDAGEADRFGRRKPLRKVVPRTSDGIPDAFLSYTRFDDEHDGGAISEFRTKLANAVRAVTGEPFKIFQDIDGIGLGEHWADKLSQMLDKARFFIPIITPSYFTSKPCREELTKFLHAEAQRGRNDLVLPIYYIQCRILEEEDFRQRDHLAHILHQRQRWDWRDQRLRTFRSRNVRSSIEALAWEIEKVLRRADVAAARHARLEPGFIFRDIDASWCPEMVVIPPGEFLLASPGNGSEARAPKQPQHLVRIAYPLAIGRYPITFEEYDHFCEATRRHHPSDQGRGRGSRPVTNLSWHDAKAYSGWLSEETGYLYRLPREAEWEYAAGRAPTRAG